MSNGDAELLAIVYWLTMVHNAIHTMQAIDPNHHHEWEVMHDCWLMTWNALHGAES